jgi:hypothetical protein
MASIAARISRAKAMKEAKEKTEYDYEGDMARGQLQSIINNAQRVHDMLKDNDNLPEWVQSKITLSEDYISTVSNYLMSEVDESSVTESDAAYGAALKAREEKRKMSNISSSDRNKLMKISDMMQKERDARRRQQEKNKEQGVAEGFDKIQEVKKFRATYHDPDTHEVTHYMDFTHRNLDAAKKHAEGSRLQRRDGKKDKLHSVVQMKEEK